MSGPAPRARRSLLDVAGREIGIVVQGGGMRGTYSIAALAELDRLGILPLVHTLGGSSAGAMNAAYFAAGQAEVGISVYTDLISNKRFINFLRRPVIDIDFLVDDILKDAVRLDVDRVFHGEIEVRSLIADVATGLGREFTQHDVEDADTLFEVMRAGAALPIVFGREIPIGDTAYVDGGLAETLYTSWLAATPLTDVVVILTRPIGYRPPSPNVVSSAFTRAIAAAAGHSPAVVHALGSKDSTFADRLEVLRRPVQGADDDPELLRTWVIAPSDTKRLCSRMTTDRELLVETARLAAEDVRASIDRGPVLIPRRALTA
jgi:predicted patatin/cPLA2 family phospholipase